MKSHERSFLLVVGALFVLTGAGLVMTSNWGDRAVSLTKNKRDGDESLVDMSQMQTAMALAPLAAVPDEHDLARDALRLSDHEIDFEFASALRQASSRALPSTPEVKTILERIASAENRVADIDSDIARINKQLSSANEKQKPALSQELELAKVRLELNEDELADADHDLERAGGNPQSRIQRMIDEHHSTAQDANGQIDVSAVGKQASSTLPASNSFLSRARAGYALYGLERRLAEAEQEARAKGDTFSSRHDELERQLNQAQARELEKLANPPSGQAAEKNTPPPSSSAPSNTNAAISSYRSLTALQRRLSQLDTRIRNEQDLAATYAQWNALASARGRALLHGLLVSFAWILLIVLGVLASDRLTDRIFTHLEPDRRKMLTMRAIMHIATRAISIVLILFVIFGPPNQMATVLALAGAGLTVALKDFIVGFFGWFVLMGKDGIRHGDWVEINGVSGEVVDIGLFRTVLLETGSGSDSGHPTGRRVTFVNSYAIEGHYFNFSTSGQWLWDELQVALPVDQDPSPIAEEIQKIVAKETEANARLAEQEWERSGNTRGIRDFSAGPAISLRPANLGFEILVRYVTRASERHQQRSKLYYEIVELLRRKNIQEPVSPAPATGA